MVSALTTEPPIENESLLAEILDDFTQRCVGGQKCSVDEVIRQYPEFASVLGEILPTVRALALRVSGDGLASPVSVKAVPGSLDFAAHASLFEPPSPYEWIGEIGRGGMGIVYAAIDRKLNRKVAIKCLKPEFCSETRIQRVRTEALSTARVIHPNIVQIYEIGEHRDSPYLILEFCAGGDLASRVRGKPQSPQFAVGTIKQICDGLTVAHQAGLIHRDIKPENILFGGDDTPKLADFGLAKHLDLNQELTQAGDVLGTPSYMAPEQALGLKTQITPAADIYSLGTVLYELLVGAPPFKGDSILETLQQVKTLEPVPPRRLRPSIPRDLETICLKCLHKEASQRYDSAFDLAHDLECFLEQRPIRARRVSWLDRVWKFAKRNPALAAMCLLLPLTVLAGILGVVTVSRALEANARERQEQIQLEGLATAIINSDINQLPTLLQQVDANPIVAGKFLRRGQQISGLSEQQRLNLILALLPANDQSAEKIWSRLWEADPRTLIVLTDRLNHTDPQFSLRCREHLFNSTHAAEERFRAAAALTHIHDVSSFSQDQSVVQLVARELVRVAPSEFGDWKGRFSPLVPQLADALEEIRVDPSQSEQARLFAIDVLCEQASAYPERILQLLVEAEPNHFRVVMDRAKVRRAAIVEAATSLLKDSPSDAFLDAFDEDTWAERQAKAAVMLLHFGHGEVVWPLLKHSPEPRVRGHLIHLIPALQVPPETLWNQLLVTEDLSVRFALLLTLAEFLRVDQTMTLPTHVLNRLQQWYQNSPEASIHSAIAVLIRRQSDDGAISLQDANVSLDQALAKQLRWFVNSQGQTFSIIDMVPFYMGSDDQESWRDRDERQHLRSVERRFAMSTTEVTREAILRWRTDFQFNQRGVTPRPFCPIGSVGWYEAAGYCNWLSQQDGVPEEQWCYVPNEQGEYAEGMHAKPGLLQLQGYRLPTEAEWEFACRSGTQTQRFYGDAEKLLSLYAWYSPLAEDECHEVAELLPNDYGLFDILGNEFEWCNDVYHAYINLAEETDPLTVGAYGDHEVTFDDQRRVLRGGSFEYTARHSRSSYRSYDNLNNRVLDNGFRIARTVIE